MRKKVNVLLLVVIIMVLSMVGCSITRSESIDTIPTERNEKFSFEPRGTYEIGNFGTEFSYYKFKSPNDNIIVYEVLGDYLICESTSGTSGTCYGDVFQKYVDFIALSEQYMLFKKGDGEMIAIDIKDDTKKKSFNDLSKPEKDSFVAYTECIHAVA